ncbi:hypothetical protein BT96DRAFT_1103955 [Gymnopus androsaceus JB14]|uniref:Uncharacterized protein n=1 Tax=Gymnopus androsaceus JB14 TaxID=1447944 RepID=A0A6A4HQE6_9AGAR|nr:hypothetical protein BT96DRAFT_1103955 [Gymnopus androsaceus JB14]
MDTKRLHPPKIEQLLMDAVASFKHQKMCFEGSGMAIRTYLARESSGEIIHTVPFKPGHGFAEESNLVSSEMHWSLTAPNSANRDWASNTCLGVSVSHSSIQNTGGRIDIDIIGDPSGDFAFWYSTLKSRVRNNNADCIDYFNLNLVPNIYLEGDRGGHNASIELISDENTDRHISHLPLILNFVLEGRGDEFNLVYPHPTTSTPLFNIYLTQPLDNCFTIHFFSGAHQNNAPNIAGDLQEYRRNCSLHCCTRVHSGSFHGREAAPHSTHLGFYTDKPFYTIGQSYKLPGLKLVIIHSLLPTILLCRAHPHPHYNHAKSTDKSACICIAIQHKLDVPYTLGLGALLLSIISLMLGFIAVGLFMRDSFAISGGSYPLVESSPFPLAHTLFVTPSLKRGKGAASSQTSTLNFGRVKISRKRDKKTDEQRRDKSYPASFKVPDLPNKPLFRQLSPLPDLPSSESSAPKEIPLPSLSENFSTSPPSTPVHPRFLPAIDLHLDEPFAIADSRYNHPILFQNTSSRINTPVHLCDDLSISPVTPGLISTLDCDPLSSPETVLSTPQSTTFDWQPVSGPDLFESDIPTFPNAARTQAAPKELNRAREALKALDALGISPFQLIDTLLNPEYSTSFHHQRTAFFRRDSTLIPRLLSRIYNDSTGNRLFLEWLPTNFISEQMEAAKPFFWMNAAKFSVDFLQNFDLRRDVSAYAQEHLSEWMYALKAATGCLGSEKKEVDTEIGRLIMTCQAMNFRSLQSSKLQFMLGIYAWATGTSKQTVEVLGAAGLSVSHPTIMKTVDIVAEQSVTEARSLSFEPHVATSIEGKETERMNNLRVRRGEHGNDTEQDQVVDEQRKAAPSFFETHMKPILFRS